MVPGSRFIPALFGEVEIDAIGQMERAKEKAHQAVAVFEGPGPVRDAEGEHAAAANDQSPAEDSHATRHEKACGMECAAIKHHPAKRQPKHSEDGTEMGWGGVHVEPNNNACDQAGRKGR